MARPNLSTFGITNTTIQIMLAKCVTLLNIAPPNKEEKVNSPP